MMKIAVHLARHRRLLALGGLSLLLHLLALAWIGGRLDLATRQAPGVAIALRLERSAASATAADGGVSAPTAAPLSESPSESASGPASGPAPGFASEPTPPAPTADRVAIADSATALPPMQPLVPAASGAPRATQPAAPALGDPRGAAVQQMPGRYQVRMPPTARLTYAVTRTRPGGAAQADAQVQDHAQLVWEAGAGRYQLRVEGVLGLLESEGGGDDAGIAPVQASEHQDDGSDRITRFDRAAGRIASSGADDPLYLGSQDRASLLMQLAGMGLAAPEQMQGVIEVMVGGPDGARATRFEVLGRERLATGAGSLVTVRLAEVTQAGRRRFELWLAPERNWMPVQLRVTEPDGSVANQVVTSIETAPSAGAAVM